MIFTENTITNATTLEFSVAQTLMTRDTSLVLGTFELPSGASFKCQWASICQLVTPGGVPTKVLGLFNTSYIAVYAGRYNGPSGLPLAVASTSSMYAQMNPNYACEIHAPDVYTVMLVNNTTNFDVEVTATLVLKLFNYA